MESLVDDSCSKHYNDSDGDDQQAASRQRDMDMSDSVRQLLTHQVAKLQHAILAEKQRRAFIDSLWFEMIHAREENITERHRSTFQWIFEEPRHLETQNETWSKKGNSWDNFVQWLKAGRGVYWINGKPGSGKSTLMNYIQNEEKTRRLLQEWAGEYDLLTPKFFFWTAGSPEQKSINGLLRSLTYQILDAKPALASPLMEFLGFGAGTSSADGSVATPAWTYERMKDAVKFLTRQESHRICFFLDGLDEVDGDYVDLLQLIKELRVMDHVKFCVSSRPEQEFEKAFKTLPSLRLQDLTYEDIESFVKDRLEGNRFIAGLLSANKSHAEALRQEIADKAEGVFLWVTLALGGLVEAMPDGESFECLEEYVESLPSDLDQLYVKICSNTSPARRQEASRIFRLILCNLSMQAVSDEEGPMYVFSLVNSTHTVLVDHFKKPCTTEQALQYLAPQPQLLLSTCQEIESQLRTKCAGLLKIGRRSIRPPDPRLRGGDLAIDFIHRSAIDFLTKTDEGRAFVGLNTQSRREIVEAHIIRLICNAILIEADSQAPSHAESSIFSLLSLEYQFSKSHRRDRYSSCTNRDLFQFAVFRAISYASLGPSAFGIPSVSLHNLLTDVELVLRNLEVLHPAEAEDGFAWYMPMGHPDICGAVGPAKEFLGLTATQDFGAYASTRLNQILHHPDKHFKDYLLSCVLFGGVFQSQQNSSIQVSIIIDLLHSGADPNAVVQNRPQRQNLGTSGYSTIWHCFLSQLCAVQAPQFKNIDTSSPSFTQVLKAFISAGANLSSFFVGMPTPPASTADVIDMRSNVQLPRAVVTVYQNLTPLSYLRYHGGACPWFLTAMQVLVDSGADFGGCVASILVKSELFTDVTDVDGKGLVKALGRWRSVKGDKEAEARIRAEVLDFIGGIVLQLQGRKRPIDEGDDDSD